MGWKTFLTPWGWGTSGYLVSQTLLVSLPWSLPTFVKTGIWLTLMTPNWWSCQCWYFWSFRNRITDPNQTCRLYRFCQHYCPLINITRPCIRIIYIIYLVKQYLALPNPLQFPNVRIETVQMHISHAVPVQVIKNFFQSDESTRLKRAIFTKLELKFPHHFLFWTEKQIQKVNLVTIEALFSPTLLL